jgi:phosphatidylserine/phosphatidylglycerophosphate/cardiolipin synthase-like enzyme
MITINISFSRKYLFLLIGFIVVITFGVFPASATEKPGKNSLAECQAFILTNENLLPLLIKSIDKARGEILMSIFSFKTGKYKDSYPDRIVTHLAKAVKRGVKVLVVLETTSNKSDELNIQNKQTGKILEEKGVNVFFDSPRKTTHTKLIVIDQRLIFLGSHNFTQSALKYNNEISVLLDRPDLAQNARDYILKIIKEGK